MNRALTLAEAMESLAGGGDPNVNLRDRWARLLEVDSEGPEYFAALTAIYSSFMELQHEISEAPLRDRAKELYASAATYLSQFANPARVASFNVSTLAQVTDRINLLHLAADALPERLVPELAEPVFDHLFEELAAIKEAATELDDPATVRVVKETISTLMMVLRSYKLLGPDGAARVYGSVAADLMRSFVQAPPTNPASKTLFQRTIATVKKAGYAVIFASAVVHGADQLLTDGTEVASILLGEGSEGGEVASSAADDSVPSSEKGLAPNETPNIA